MFQRNPLVPWPFGRPRLQPPVAPQLRREAWFTLAGLAITLIAAGFCLVDITGVLVDRARVGTWSGTAGQALFLLIFLSLIYGACVYLLARLGFLRRMAHHVPASPQALAALQSDPRAPLVTLLVPSYMEDERIVGRTLLSAALQSYPRRRVVLLIDDPPRPATPEDADRLRRARALPAHIERVLDAPRRLCADALRSYRRRQTHGDTDDERARLADVEDAVAQWLEEQAERYDGVDHADRLFVDMSFRLLAARHRIAAVRLRRPGLATADEIDAAYRRLVAQFDAEVTSFERKRYDNLSHAPNKAMNLNSYIALLGGTFRERRRGGTLVLEPASDLDADLRVPSSEFVVAVDADSVLTPDYAVRLVHVMQQPGHEDVAIVQTPYSAFPGATASVERIAGATTDIQRLIHQGFSRYGATYWVGANALIRTAALRDIAQGDTERGHAIVRFIQDRTLIEDTESTVDLLAKGWRLYNYPAPLAYSETPPDFGSLLIQRRRWANGGLIILPRLLRHAISARAAGARVAQTFMMAHYLVSLAAVNLGLLVVLAFSFEDSLRTSWLPLTAVPYYALYARDLERVGYRFSDALRTYALNLVLIPVNLVGVFGSLYQAMFGPKALFGRTPKVPGRTPIPALYLLALLGLGLQWLLRAVGDVVEDRPVHAALAVSNVGFLVYGIAAFIGVRNFFMDCRDAVAWRARALGAWMRRAAADVYELPAAGDRFAAIEGFRAYAAFLIFLVHYCDSYATRVLRVDPNALRLSTAPDLWTGVVYYLFASHYGVDVFFFLSGFLICRLVRRPAFGYRTFVLRRLVRIYPAFLVSLLVWAYVRIAVQRWYGFDVAQFAGNLLFLNAVDGLGVRPYNTVTWSLFFEMVFYVTFPLVLWRAHPDRRVTPTRILVFAAAFLPLVLLGGPFFIRFLMFFGGALFASLPEPAVRAVARRVPEGFAVALYAASTLVFAQWLDYTYFIPLFVVTTFVLMAKLTHGDGVLARWFAWTPLRYFGNVSYSFYLVHGLGIELTMNLYGDVFAGLGGVTYLLVTFAVSLGIAWVLSTMLFVAAEKPYFTWRGVSLPTVGQAYAARRSAAAE